MAGGVPSIAAFSCRKCRHLFMGVDHGGQGTSPPEFGVGDANANCPPQILSYRYKKELLWPEKYTPKSIFGWGSAADPAGGAHNAPPDP